MQGVESPSQPNEGVHWSGECKDGLAHGRGVVQWLRDNTPLERDEGEWRQGRQTGKAVQVWPTGRFEGEVANGEPSWHRSFNPTYTALRG